MYEEGGVLAAGSGTRRATPLRRHSAAGHREGSRCTSQSAYITHASPPSYPQAAKGYKPLPWPHKHHKQSWERSRRPPHFISAVLWSVRTSCMRQLRILKCRGCWIRLVQKGPGSPAEFNFPAEFGESFCVVPLTRVVPDRHPQVSCRPPPPPASEQPTRGDVGRAAGGGV